MATFSYFHGWGLGEQIRWMLAATLYKCRDDHSASGTGKDGAAAAVQADGDTTGWINVGLDTHEQFLTLRKEGKLLFNQLPLLEIDGMRLVCDR